MTDLYFQKLSKYDRMGEPVSFSIPFAQDTLLEPERLCVLDGGVRLPKYWHGNHMLARVAQHENLLIAVFRLACSGAWPTMSSKICPALSGGVTTQGDS